MTAVTIDGIEYAPVLATEGEQLRITIVDNRGLTFVGYTDLDESKRFITIRKARCIIRWGTTQHIAELANGPLEKTVLGLAHDVTIHMQHIVASYVVTGEWYD